MSGLVLLALLGAGVQLEIPVEAVVVPQRVVTAPAIVPRVVVPYVVVPRVTPYVALVTPVLPPRRPLRYWVFAPTLPVTQSPGAAPSDTIQSPNPSVWVVPAPRRWRYFWP